MLVGVKLSGNILAKFELNWLKIRWTRTSNVPSISWKIGFERKGKIDVKTFFRPDEIKTPQDNYLRFDKREAQLTL